jgi:hypothetical protein
MEKIINIDDLMNGIKDCLKKLSSKQKAKFAWLCAIRALTFLGTKSNFIYWKEKNKQRMLLSIFRAIDISAYALYSTDVPTYAVAADAAANAAANAANAAYAAADAADAADKAAYAADAVYATAYAANRDLNKNKLFELLCSDIDKIYENKNNDFDNGFFIYGGIWQKFLDELKAIGCGYWANLYMDLFSNQFKINKEKLELRINVPMEIREKGASAVGEWLENI